MCTCVQSRLSVSCTSAQVGILVGKKDATPSNSSGMWSSSCSSVVATAEWECLFFRSGKQHCQGCFIHCDVIGSHLIGVQQVPVHLWDVLGMVTEQDACVPCLLDSHHVLQQL